MQLVNSRETKFCVALELQSGEMTGGTDLLTMVNRILWNLSMQRHMLRGCQVAPTRYQPVLIRQNILQSMRWGLIPRWSSTPSEVSKSPPRSLKTINARDDAIAAGSPLWKSVRHQRCVVIAQGYYEWNSKDKTPYFLTRRKDLPTDTDLLDTEFIWMAGLYECTTKNNDKEWSYTIVTTSAAPDVSFLHNRMPVIFTTKTQAEDWLSYKRFEDVVGLMAPLENGLTL